MIITYIGFSLNRSEWSKVRMKHRLRDRLANTRLPGEYIVLSVFCWIKALMIKCWKHISNPRGHFQFNKPLVEPRPSGLACMSLHFCSVDVSPMFTAYPVGLWIEQNSCFLTLTGTVPPLSSVRWKTNKPNWSGNRIQVCEFRVGFVDWPN